MASSTGVVDAAAILTEEVVVAKSRRCAIRALRANIRVMFPVNQNVIQRNNCVYLLQQ
jgi:hypothetical protein